MSDTVTLRVTSPCHHGKTHEIRELPEGVHFATRACVDSRGIPRDHLVSPDLYPTKVRRR